MFRRARHIHFVGIGGIGMSGLAELLLALGYRVSGSDIAESPTVLRLRDLGAEVCSGHSGANLGGADVVVTSSAIPADNPEVHAARAGRVPVIPRAEMLAELMRRKQGLAVAGSHGKTTTTSMLAVVCAAAGLDPTVVVGGQLRSLGTNAHLGKGNYLVAEADESDGSFLKLTPTLAIVTNIDPEHLDHYGSFEALKDAFVHFINQVPFYGGAVLCFDHPTVREILPRVEKPIVTYGLAAQAELRGHGMKPEGRGVRFLVDLHGDPLGTASIPMPGRHNVANALAVIAAALELDIPFPTIVEGLASFEGVSRRMEYLGERGGVTVVDDYAHHPAELRATLKALRESHQRPLRVVFQPHRYSRTRDLFDEFLSAFDEADTLGILDIYPANEDPIPGVSAQALVEGLRERGHRSVCYLGGLEQGLEWMLKTSRAPEVMVTLGAGSVSKLSHQFFQQQRGMR